VVGLGAWGLLLWQLRRPGELAAAAQPYALHTSPAYAAHGPHALVAAAQPLGEAKEEAPGFAAWDPEGAPLGGPQPAPFGCCGALAGSARVLGGVAQPRLLAFRPRLALAAAVALVSLAACALLALALQARCTQVGECWLRARQS
jgi:hypothetical protein